MNANNLKLFIGLGNIGKSYEMTRHNVGFMFLEFLSKNNSANFLEEKKFCAFVAEETINQNRTILAKPTTFMNDSGIAVQSISKYFNIEVENITVIHDDLDIDFGNFKIQTGKGPRVHNGLLSIEQHLGTNLFNRIRIGIENRGELRANISGRDYVLSKFSKEEQQKLNEEIFPQILENLS